MQVQPGDRVTIHGLKAKPELNGQSAVLVGQAANGRITVRLDSGQEIALKQENLGVQAPGGAGGAGGMPGGAGGGMPGFGGGGMPGFGGGGMPGMPGGMPDVQAMAAQATAALQKMLADAGIQLPPGMSLMQAAGIAVVAALVGLYVITRFVSTLVLMLAGLAAYWGTMTASGRKIFDQGSAKVSSVLRRPVPKGALLCAFCLGVAILGHMLLPKSSASSSRSSGTSGGASTDAAFAQAIREAYDQGYDDGVAGASRRPPKHIPSPDFSKGATSESKSSSGFGLSSLMKYGMVGYTVYNMGKVPGGGWNPQLAIANAKANPVQVIVMLVLMSGILI